MAPLLGIYSNNLGMIGQVCTKTGPSEIDWAPFPAHLAVELIDVWSPQLPAAGCAKHVSALWAHTFPGAASHKWQELWGGEGWVACQAWGSPSFEDEPGARCHLDSEYCTLWCATFPYSRSWGKHQPKSPFGSRSLTWATLMMATWSPFLLPPCLWSLCLSPFLPLPSFRLQLSCSWPLPSHLSSLGNVPSPLTGITIAQTPSSPLGLISAPHSHPTLQGDCFACFYHSYFILLPAKISISIPYLIPIFFLPQVQESCCYLLTIFSPQKLPFLSQKLLFFIHFWNIFRFLLS